MGFIDSNVEFLGLSIPVPTALIWIVNLFPLIGVLFFGWNAGSILLIYWAESGIIGFFTLIKILLSKSFILLKLFISFFFCIHFGGFMIGHLIFILTFAFVYAKTSPITLTNIPNWFLMIIFLFISHTIVFKKDLNKPSIAIEGLEKSNPNSKEFVAPISAMFSPYPRIVIMHITLVIGFIGVMIFTSSFPQLPQDAILKGSSFILVTLKLILEFFVRLKY